MQLDSVLEDEIEELLDEIKANSNDCRNVEILGNCSDIKKRRFEAIWQYWEEIELTNCAKFQKTPESNQIRAKVKVNSFNMMPIYQKPKAYQRKRFMFEYFTTNIKGKDFCQKNNMAKQTFSDMKKTFIKELSNYVAYIVPPQR